MWCWSFLHPGWKDNLAFEAGNLHITQYICYYTNFPWSIECKTFHELQLFPFVFTDGKWIYIWWLSWVCCPSRPWRCQPRCDLPIMTTRNVEVKGLPSEGSTTFPGGVQWVSRVTSIRDYWRVGASIHKYWRVFFEFFRELLRVLREYFSWCTTSILVWDPSLPSSFDKVSIIYYTCMLLSCLYHWHSIFYFVIFTRIFLALAQGKCQKFSSDSFKCTFVTFDHECATQSGFIHVCNFIIGICFCNRLTTCCDLLFCCSFPCSSTLQTGLL